MLAALMAIVCGVPALLEAGAYHLGAIPFLINMPGILLAVPHIPPEGYPGQSPLHATLMLLAQTAVWFTILTVIAFIRARRTRAGVAKA